MERKNVNFQPFLSGRDGKKVSDTAVEHMLRVAVNIPAHKVNVCCSLLSQEKYEKRLTGTASCLLMELIMWRR